MLARGDEARDVGDVHHEVGAHLPGDLAELFKVDDPGIGGSAGDDHLRAVLQGQLAHLVIVDQAGNRVAAISDAVVDLAGEAGLRAVGQVAAAAQVHAHHGVAGMAQRQVHRRIGLGTAVGLHVGIFHAEQLLGALDADVFHLIHVFAAAIIAMPRIALRILVRQHRTHGGHDRLGHDVLRRDQLQVAALALQLLQHYPTDFRVILANEFHALLYHFTASMS